jgi:hypothetical protein
LLLALCAPLASAFGAPAPGLNKVTGAMTPPPPPPDDYNRYGKILVPNDQFTSAFKLSMPFPGVGEISVPTKEEITMRVKLEELATLSNQQIREQLEKWPAYNTMSLADEGAMLGRIQQFRDRRYKVADAKARELGLLTLSHTQQVRFEKEYWDKRLKMDEQLAAQFLPIVKADSEKLDADLFREFSTTHALAQGPKAPAPKAAAGKPAPAAAPTTASDTMMMH